MWDNHYTFNVSALLTSIKAKLKDRFITFWKKSLNSEIDMDKLRAYKVFKKCVKKLFGYSTKAKLKERFSTFWKKSLNSEIGMDKLRAYKVFKKYVKNYLDILPDRKRRKALTVFRLSAHNLKIERHRYSGYSLEDRLCNVCNIEDEINFLCACYKYQDFRNKMFQSTVVLNNHSFDEHKLPSDR